MCVSGYTVTCLIFFPCPLRLSPGSVECWPAAVYPLSPTCVRHPGSPGADPDACNQCTADNADRSPARTAAVQPVHRRTAALPDPASDYACRPGHHAAHVHPVHQPELRWPSHAGDRGLSRVTLWGNKHVSARRSPYRPGLRNTLLLCLCT